MPGEESGWSLNRGESPPPTARFRPAGERETFGSAQPPCILIVEDNAGDAALIRQSLLEHNLGLAAILVTDGEQAVRYIEQAEAGTVACPALIVLDLNLPKLSGAEVLQRIRQSRSCGNVPVAVFSSSDAFKDRQQAERLGANRYIRKSHNLDEFLTIGKVLKELLRETGS